MVIEGDELKRKRDALGLSHEEVARRIGVSARTYARWEKRGIARPVRSNTAKALEALDELVARRGTARTTEGFGLVTPARPREYPPYVGHEAQRAVGVYLGQLAKRESRAFPVLVFGYPGTGKSRFALALADELSAEGFHLTWLRLAELSEMWSVAEQRRAIMESVDGVLWNTTAHPRLIVMDEIDALAGPGGRHETPFARWLHNLIRRLDLEGRAALVLAVANYPREVDPILLSEFGLSIYLDPPDRRTLAAILAHEGVPQANEVAHELVERHADEGTVVSLRQVSRALGLAWELEPAIVEGRAGPYRGAELLHTLASGVPQEAVAEYRRSNETRILQAESLVALVHRAIGSDRA